MNTCCPRAGATWLSFAEYGLFCRIWSLLQNMVSERGATQRMPLVALDLYRQRLYLYTHEFSQHTSHTSVTRSLQTET